MVLENIKIGQKFVYKNKVYLKIDMNPSTMFLNNKYDGIICALDMETFKVMCLSKSTEIKEVFQYGENYE